MRAQVREQGRHQGGRPPYGYRLVDAGPHPNPVHALWGRRLHRLELDPVTAPWVRWMFARRLAGFSAASIARELNERGVLCPSSVDRARNRHRSGEAWTLRTVAAILGNPRYTGRQVWNRQQSHCDPGGQHLSGVAGLSVRRWNPAQEWVVSAMVVHPPIVSEQDFIAAQAINAVAGAQDGSAREYLLVGLVQCGQCGRRMESHWVHGRPGYRCRHGHNSSKSALPGRARNLYLREDRIVARVLARLGELGLHDGGEPATASGDLRDVLAVLRDRDLVIRCDPGACIMTTPRGLL
jgi:hypothetical protein